MVVKDTILSYCMIVLLFDFFRTRNVTLLKKKEKYKGYFLIHIFNFV